MLFESLRPHAPSAPKGIDLRCCDVTEILKEVRGARLITADPPWRYAREAGGANPEKCGIYAGLSEIDVAQHLDMSYECTTPNALLAVWYTWPKEEEWRGGGARGATLGEKEDRWRMVENWAGWSWPLLEGPNRTGCVVCQGFLWPSA